MSASRASGDYHGSGTAFMPDPDWPSIVELATERWGEPTSRKPDEVRFGGKGSKSATPSRNIWHDHETVEGSGYIEMHRATRGELPKAPHKGPGARQKPLPSGRAHPPSDDIACLYDYHDGSGALVLQLVRTRSGEPRFRQRRPDGNGGWLWSTKEIAPADRPLYRLPGLRASGDTRIWIAEGEKDCDTLHDEGLIATTSIGGAGKWRLDYAKEFRGKPVVILPDNDKPGRDHAEAVARSLVGMAASVKVLTLPGLADKQDVTDWFDAGHTVDELERLADATSE